MPGKNFIIDVVPYPVEVMVSYCQTNDELIKNVKKWKCGEREQWKFIESIEDDTDPRDVGLIHHIEGTGFIIIRLFKPVKTPDQRGTLAHEVFHAAERTAHQIGLIHCEQSSEAFAYLIQFLTIQIYKKL